MANDDDIIPDNEKTVFDWCKEDDVTQVSRMLQKCDINKKDSEVISLTSFYLRTYFMYGITSVN